MPNDQKRNRFSFLALRGMDGVCNLVRRIGCLPSNTLNYVTWLYAVFVSIAAGRDLANQHAANVRALSHTDSAHPERAPAAPSPPALPPHRFRCSPSKAYPAFR
jgi:hypothetical protein